MLFMTYQYIGSCTVCIPLDKSSIISFVVKFFVDGWPFGDCTWKVQPQEGTWSLWVDA